jgi:signal transduction histidine kinase
MTSAFRIGHRARMTTVNALFAGFVLLILFVAAVVAFSELELISARQELARALKQSVEEYRKNPLSPNLAEIALSYPDLSIAVFNAEKRPVFVKGNVKVPFETETGIGEVSGIKVYLSYLSFKGGTAVAAVSWGRQQNAIRRLVGFLALLWLPAMALFGIITWRSSQSTFEPLERLASQAEALSAENLSSRLTEETGEYAQFAQRLNRFLDRLEASVKREDKFASDAAHELRTPLTVMKGRVETALLRNREPEEYRRTLKEVGAEVERLSGLVELLLQSATLVQGVVPPIDLQEQVERAHARWVDRFTDRSVELALESQPCQARILPREADVIIDNLLSNALKASPAHSRCELRLLCDEKKSWIHVTDEGNGVPPERAEAIFERFTRLDEGRNRDEGGFGIGLAVCRRIAEGRGGKIYLKPSAVGAHFVVELAT